MSTRARIRTDVLLMAENPWISLDHFSSMIMMDKDQLD
jgi:hypothetical protein